MLSKKSIILCGHYGSGKSEIASNIALKSVGDKVRLYDLDIVNPYFRNNLLLEKFKESGVEFISGTVEGINIDLPSLPNVNSSENSKIIIDLGGDSVGAKILKFYPKGKFKDMDLLIVINCNRFETKNRHGVLKYIKSIEEVVGLKVTGLISNTHLLKETTLEDILKGYNVVKEIQMEKGIPIMAITYPEDFVDKNEVERVFFEEGIQDKLLPLNLNLREKWMS